MKPKMHRRQVLAGAIAAGAALAAPGRVFAQAAAGPRDRRLLEIAQREMARAANVLWRNDVVGIADFGLHSSVPRFHFVDMLAGRVNSVLVAHGSGSDPEHDGWLNGFSNLPDSWATSRGAYITWEWYVGRYGTSVRLGGLDGDNSNAFDRAIVLHQASYVTPEHVARWGRCGRSNGCPAFGPDAFNEALARLSGGRLIFADTLGIGDYGETIAMPWQAPVDFNAVVAENRARAAGTGQTDADELARIYAQANPGLATD